MKKKLLLIITVFTTSFVMAQSIPNGGFENWTSQSCRNPQYYGSSNLQAHGGSNTFGPINVVKTTDAYVDSFAVNLTTTLTGNDTSGAYLVNFNPNNGASFTGGISYTQTPTSLHYYYKCNVMPGDTALILVLFKSAGTVFSQNIQKITGTKNAYTLGVMPLNLFGITPDTLMFAALSSNILNGNFKGIPGSMLQLDSVNFDGVISQPADMNGDFEHWQTTFSNPTLDGWGGVSYNTINNQTTDKYAGNYALELKSTQTNQANDSVYTSNISTGYSIQNGTGGGYPYALTVDTLKFHYKYIPGGTSDDSASVQLNFKKNGVFVGNQSILLPAAASYTQAVLTYSLMQTPDTVLVYINSSKRWILPVSYLGSDLKIDNMYFASQATPVTNFTLQPTGCVGQAVQLTDMSGNIPTTWTWTTTGGNSSGANTQNPTVTYTNTGTYTVTLNTSNASGSGTPLSQTITINSLPVITITPSSTTVCVGGTVTLTAEGPIPQIYTYTWSNTGATTSSITPSPTVTTQYTVTGTDVNGCMNTETLSISVINCGTGINQLSSSDISIYPNPNNGVFTIKGTSELNNLQIVNELGQVIKTISLKQAYNYQVDVTGLEKGVYFLIGNLTKQRFIVIN